PAVRNHATDQGSPRPDFERASLVRPSRSDRTAFPCLLQEMEQLGSIRVLAHRKARSNLPPESMPPTRLERNAETTLSIYEAGNVGREIRSQDQGRRVM